MPHAVRIKALAASLRLPNLPSVLSNVLTGCLFAGFEAEACGLALFTGTCLYLAGNLLNDWADRKWDEVHRCERALPSGLFTPRSYLQSGIILILLGWTAAALASPAALLISMLISGALILYTWSHKRSSWAVIPMGACRALLPILGYFAITSEGTLIKVPCYLAAPALMTYIVMLSLRARSESTASSRRMSALCALGLFAPPLPLLIYSAYSHPEHWIYSLVGSLPYIIWISVSLTLLRSPVGRQVSALLAGIPLIDAMFIMPIALFLGGFHPILWAWLLAFIAGRMLQRYVPAT